MAKKTSVSSAQAAVHPLSGAIFVATSAEGSGVGVPVFLIDSAARLAALTPEHQTWLEAQGFKPAQRKVVLLPGHGGAIAGVVIGSAPMNGAADPLSRPELAAGLVAAQVPPGLYRLDYATGDAELMAVAWGLGAYRFRRYKSGKAEPWPLLALPAGVDGKRVAAIVDGAAFGRDLINTPASDMGPAEIEAAARMLGNAHGATVSSIVGDALLAENFPLIHAVGRASPRAPRLIDLTWQPAAHNGPLHKVTLIGKGIAFDTGGLDLKPSSGMLIMKKDMGGAAAVLAAAHMIMSAQLPVRLRVIIAAAENSVAGNAFRPLDVIKSRNGLTVEIGNTDAEGRLVLADAIALADEEAPDIIMTFATLTGAARVALGPDLPPFFTDDEAFAAEIAAAGLSVADPVWRLPFWTAYEAGLESPVADLNNVADGPFAGSIIAALFLRKFVTKARCFAHFDIYGWRQAAKALGPRGGEVNAARAVFALLAKRHA